MTQIYIYDTTLRDGSQGEGVSFSVDDKLKVAQRLDEMGIHYIEGGWPGSNAKDVEFFQRARGLIFQRAKLAAFGATRRANTPCEIDGQIAALLEAGTPVVTIVGKTWDLHVHRVLETTLDENLAMIADSVRYLKAQGREVFYDAEHFFDGYKANPQYALATIRAAYQAGADTVILCETNGGSMPWEVEEIVRAAGQSLAAAQPAAGPARLGIHTHDDSGLAVANALAGVRAGATQVQGTINGYGERVGNCNLCTVVPDLQIKMGHAMPGRGRASPAHRALTIRQRDRKPGAGQPGALCGRQRIRPQGRHPRRRDHEGRRELPAHRSDPRGQRETGAGQRALRPRQPGL